MGKKNKKYKESVPYSFVMDSINKKEPSELLLAAQLICPTDYEIIGYNDNSSKYFHDDNSLRKALRRSFSIGAFEHRKQLIAALNLYEEYRIYLNTPDETIRKYIEYIDANFRFLCSSINKKFEETKDYSRKHFIKIIASMIDKDTIHYEWIPSNNWEPWDHSGELKKDGLIDLSQTIYSFLNDEYTGQWTPSYTPGSGKNYITYGDDLSYDTLNYANNILKNTVLHLLEEHFCEKIDGDLFVDIMDERFDDIYTSCIASDFFCWEGAVDFYDIGNYKLKDILK